MKVLIITPFFPYPTDSGGNTRSFNLLKQLGRHGVEVVQALVTAEAIEENRWRAFHDLLPHVRTVRMPFANRKAEKVGYYALNLLGFDRILCHRRTKKALQQLIADERIDVIQTDYSQVARYLPQTDRPSVLGYIEFRCRVLEREAALQQGVPAHARALLRWKIMEREELSYCRRYDRVVCVSEEDRRWLLSRRPRARISVIENGVNAAEYAWEEGGGVPKGLYFIGWFMNRQNVLALDFFVQHVWPRVRSAYGDFVVIGKDLDGARRSALGAAGIRYLGYLETPRLREATRNRALVVPLLTGGGTRLKILEAMAMGRPVVSTPIGAEGLAVEDGKHLLLAGEPQDFVNALLRLRSEEGLAARLTAAARARVQERYDWKVIGGRLYELYERLAGGPGS
ncbi:MAG: glycosyltransferase [Kiritimatiellae bacterium]|nr:glycosyltransferase [Kiritimatiellia bacterium]